MPRLIEVPIISERAVLLGARQASPRKFGQNTVSHMLSVAYCLVLYSPVASQVAAELTFRGL